MANEGLRLFGVMAVSVPTTDGFGFVIGIRTANGRSFATQLAAGARVFVCDNLAFSGELIAMNRKHTAHFDLNADLSRAVDKYQQHLLTFGRKFEGLKNMPLERPIAAELILEAVSQDIVPARAFPAVLEAYKAHRGSLNAWDLHNMMTASFKQLSPAALFQSTARLGQLFELTA